MSAAVETYAPGIGRDTARLRTFESDVATGDGRTLDIRVVPYGVPALVADPGEPPYREMFRLGAFERQAKAASRVWLNFEHEQGLRGIVGHGVTLEERDDGCYGSFDVLEGADGEKALRLVEAGLLTGVSMEFVALRSRRVDGIVERLRAHIDKVSLCRFPAYSGAEVLAVREEPREQGAAAPAPEFLPPESDLSERLEALGVVPLLRVATTERPWDGSPGRFTDEEYAKSALVCRPGDDPPKQRCSLPVLEPSGALNVNALGAAAAALAGARGGVANVSREQKAQAARKLVRLYAAAGKEPPPSLRALAGSA